MIKKPRLLAQLGFFGGLILAFTSLAIGIYQTALLFQLLHRGERAHGVVVGIDVGVKGGRRAVFEFTTESGKLVRSRDFFQMMLIRQSQGDEVVVLYDPSNLKIATIDMGLWTWQQPAVFYFGFVLLLGVTFFLRRWESTVLKE